MKFSHSFVLIIMKIQLFLNSAFCDAKFVKCEAGGKIFDELIISKENSLL